MGKESTGFWIPANASVQGDFAYTISLYLHIDRMCSISLAPLYAQEERKPESEMTCLWFCSVSVVKSQFKQPNSMFHVIPKSYFPRTWDGHYFFNIHKEQYWVSALSLFPSTSMTLNMFYIHPPPPFFFGAGATAQALHTMSWVCVLPLSYILPLQNPFKSGALHLQIWDLPALSQLP